MAGDYMIIVSVGDRAGFLLVSDSDNLAIVPDIQECTKWEVNTSEEPSKYLEKARNGFENLQFVAISVPKIIFGNKPRRVRKG